MTERQLGINAFREGRFREAVDRLRTAAKDDERTISQEIGFQTYAYLGAALYALGEAANAAEVFASAVSLSMGSAPPLDLMINLAHAYLASNQRRLAEQTLLEVLQHNPGAMEARMLLERLRNRDESLPLTGSIFGESTESVRRYLDTLTFSTCAKGFSPVEVRAALVQIQHYIETLSGQLSERDQSLSEQAAEIERLRQTEEALIDNMFQIRQDLEQFRRSSDQQDIPVGPADYRSNAATGNSENASLTPLEKLFQKKS